MYSDSSTQDITLQVTWSVSPSSLATISSAGVLATATTAGSGSVGATLGSVSGSTPVTVVAASLQSIQISPSTATVPVGATQQFAATGIYQDAGGVLSSYDVTTQPGGLWQSSNTAVAGINGSGLATALAAGSSSITFALQGVTSAAAAMTVPSGVTLSSIYIDQTDPVTLDATGANSTVQLTATATYSDGSTVDPMTGLTWSVDPSSASGVISVDPVSGLVTAQGVGAAIVDVSYNGTVQDTIGVQVSAVTLSSIAVTTNNPSIPLGYSTQFSATGTFSDGSTSDITTQVTWTVQDPTIASISNDPGTATSPGTQGLATSLAQGSTTVVASLNGVTGSASLTVTSATLSSITLTPAGAANLPLGYNLQFTAQATYSDGTQYDVTGQATWTSDNSAVAAISNAAGSQGLATALATGTANIRANVGSVASAPTALTVDTASLVSIAVTPTGATMTTSSFLQFHATGTFSDGSSIDLTKQVSWSVTKIKHMVTISNATATKGLAHACHLANKNGTVTVKATKNGITSPGVTVNKVS